MCLKSNAIILCFVFFNTVHNSKILGIFPTPAHSHFTLGFRLMKELAHRGHQVTVINPFPQKIPITNYKDVPVENMIDVLKEFQKIFYDREKMNMFNSIKTLHQMAYYLTKNLVAHENVQQLLNSNETFDLVIMEYFMSEATMGIASKLNAPLILSSSLPSSALNNYLVSNPAPISYVPYILSEYNGRMNIFQRLKNLCYNIVDTIYKELVMVPLHEKLLKTYISKKLTMDEVRFNATLLFLNSHPSISEPVPHVPNMIEIGGFHVDEPEQLPKNLQRIMDESGEGVVLFSMGSNLKSCDLSDEKRNAILTAFGKIKQKVIWKFEDENLKNLPDNVEIFKWLPQKQILAHKNTKAFISHGGLLSTIESVYFGVPILGIPIYGDQKMNIATAVSNGYAVSVSLQELNEENFSNALDQILNNPSYKTNAVTRSKIMNDRPVKPLDLAVYWAEYVIKHQGAMHLRTPGMRLRWFEKYMVDIIIIMSVCITTAFVLFIIIFKHILKWFKRKIE